MPDAPIRDELTDSLSPTPLSGSFIYPRTAEVVYGPGSLTELPRLLAGLGRGRAYVIASRTLAQTGVETLLRELLGPRFVGISKGVEQHVPRSAVLAVTHEARAARADVLISVGGSTAGDCAKGVALCLATGIDAPSEFDRYRLAPPGSAPPLAIAPAAATPLVAVPTTLSGSEHTGVIGITDEALHEKQLFVDDTYYPRAVILDAELAARTPRSLWAGSALKAIDHAVASIASARHVPFRDALAKDAVRGLRTQLGASLRDSPDLAALTACQLAAWMAIYGLMNTGVGLSHALGHQLAVRLNLPHGATSAITLPRVLRAMQPLPPERLTVLAAAFSVKPVGSDEDIAHAVIAELEQMIAELAAHGVAPSLETVPVSAEQLRIVADTVHHDLGCPTRPDVDELFALLETAL